MQDKKRKKKEAIKLIQQAKISPDAYDFDLSRLPMQDYVKVLDAFFGSDRYDEVEAKRHKLCMGLSAPKCNVAMIVGGIQKMDRKIADMIYDVMFVHCVANDEHKEGEPRDILEFFKQFNGDEEKEHQADLFWKAMRKIYMLSDILIGYIKDAQTAMDKLDSEQRFINVTRTMGAAMNNMQMVVSHLAKFNNEDENALFMQTCDSVEGYIDMRATAFDKKIDKIIADRRKKEALELKEKRAKNNKK